ncbi:MAG: thiamine pyrophosphate-dependent enzyme [Candidatus Daviesbacteria bacterium]|nr:thiamine pyrophosphate-dependent enzyme [Candidatus Daviesbacteria bacterium]
MKLEDLTTKCKSTWCPGCGNFGLWGAFKNAAVSQNWDNTNTCLVAGIGCHGHILNFTKITSVEGLHGRAIPVATGIKLANNKLNVFVFTGDGDCLAEGGNHFIHACRRNHNLTIIVHNNALFSLTTGQTCPTTPLGEKTKSTPSGNLDYPIHPVTLAIASGATFVARAFASDLPKLQEIIIAANAHDGLSVVDVLQPCPTLNKDYTNQFFRENCYQLGPDHDVKNKVQAFAKSLEWGLKQIPLGILYQEEKPSYESAIIQIKEKPLIESSTNRNMEELFKKYV